MNVSIPHMGCMPYGRIIQNMFRMVLPGFNPSYGLHALRAPTTPAAVSSEKSGFNPSYGLHALRA